MTVRLVSLFFFTGYVGLNSSFPDPLPAEEERRCLEAMAQGDELAREKLIEHNLRLVAHIAKKYASPKRDSDDLISIGTVGLIKAVSTFNASKSKTLAAYAARCIENEILMSLRAEKKQNGEPAAHHRQKGGLGRQKCLCLPLCGGWRGGFAAH
ncbi:rNA polymerase sigma factor [Clostridium sp. CAG:226]|nr:rNA polymerase sigma factor [Clostridium sp. CAG:226]